MSTQAIAEASNLAESRVRFGIQEGDFPDQGRFFGPDGKPLSGVFNYKHCAFLALPRIARKRNLSPTEQEAVANDIRFCKLPFDAMPQNAGSLPAAVLAACVSS